MGILLWILISAFLIGLSIDLKIGLWLLIPSVVSFFIATMAGIYYAGKAM